MVVPELSKRMMEEMAKKFFKVLYWGLKFVLIAPLLIIFFPILMIVGVFVADDSENYADNLFEYFTKPFKG